MRTLGSDSVRGVSGQLGGRVYRVLWVGSEDGLWIGRAGLFLGYRGWELWEGFVIEAGEDLFVQVLQVDINRRKLGGRHDCDLKHRWNVRR